MKTNTWTTASQAKDKPPAPKGKRDKYNKQPQNERRQAELETLSQKGGNSVTQT